MSVKNCTHKTLQLVNFGKNIQNIRTVKIAHTILLLLINLGKSIQNISRDQLQEHLLNIERPSGFFYSNNQTVLSIKTFSYISSLRKIRQNMGFLAYCTYIGI